MFKLTAETTLPQFEQAIKPEMDKAIKHFEHEISKLRTGRASTALVEDLKVLSYGAFMPLKEIAAISTPDVRLIVIQPWDKSIIAEIEKTIQNSDLGINPLNDGTIIRLQLPQMSAERREELTKVLSKKEEESKIIVRNVRKDFQTIIRDAEKKKVVSEDISKKLQTALQKQTDNFIANIETISKKKAVEIKA